MIIIANLSLDPAKLRLTHPDEPQPALLSPGACGLDGVE